jgi:hypothetical protein
MRAVRLVAALALPLLGLSVAAPAQELSLSLAAGSFRASEEAYREIYGAGTPFAVDVWLKLKGPLGLAVGYGRLADQGNALPLGEGEAEYPVKFSRTSIPVTIFWRFYLKAVDVRLGAGLCFHSYKENWETVELSFKGHKTSPRFYAAMAFPILPRLSLFGSIAYDSIPTGAGSLLANDINLGGLQLLGGLAVRIF